MIDGLVDALKSINSTTNKNNLAVNSLNYARSFVLTLAVIDHRLNILKNHIQKLESDISTIYNYIDSPITKLLYLH